jgi:hypothetical protein
MKAFTKERVQSIRSKTPAEWSAAITETIKEPHLQGWAASIIYYDLASDEALGKEAWDTLEPLIEQYGTGRTAYGYQTPDLIRALESIGYEQAAARCDLKTNQCERSDGLFMGALTRIDRRWSGKASRPKARPVIDAS